MCKKNDAKTRKNRPFEPTKPTKSEPYTGVFQAQSGTLTMQLILENEEKSKLV